MPSSCPQRPSVASLLAFQAYNESSMKNNDASETSVILSTWVNTGTTWKDFRNTAVLKLLGLSDLKKHETTRYKARSMHFLLRGY